jgi:hypothetical protein
MSVASSARREVDERDGGLLRDGAVSKDAKSVQSAGKPMSASTNRGLSARAQSQVISPTIELLGPWRPSSPLVGASGDGSAPSFQSRAVGVAHIRRTAASVNVVPELRVLVVA